MNEETVSDIVADKAVVDITDKFDMVVVGIDCG